MKHVGSNDGLQDRAEPVAAGLTGPVWLPGNPAAQSRTSILVALTLGMLLVAVIADAPIRALAQSLDPSLKITLRYVTGFGNSAWPLGIGLALLGVVWFVRRQTTPINPANLQSLRSALILLVASVALSGFLASLSKHIIGRIRPSTDADAQVLEFWFMAFKSGWAAFPSGHATTATAAAMALALCFPRHAWAFLSIGVTASLSRALLEVHWFSDCLAGVVLGAWFTVVMHRRMVARGHLPQVAPGTLGLVLTQAAVEFSRIAAVAATTIWTRATHRNPPVDRR
ncbi:phosphatase PAP2 family protein [Tabrizicola sp.]|uniref:phosphatase PAP2 family protein n=1 Tax=Tabrizicola sp. TaxID=2005166 RepID=UPI003F37E568